MAQVTLSQTVNAPLADVWASWDDFANIAAFNPVVQKSFLTGNGPATGLGARRQCDLADGKNYIREEITGYEPEKFMEIDIYDGTMPLKQARAVVRLEPRTLTQTKVTMTMAFTPKMGLIGKAMLPIMKKQFAAMLRQLLEGNAAHVEQHRAANAA